MRTTEGVTTTCAGIISFDPFYSSTLDTPPLSVLYRIAHLSQIPLKDGNPASTRFPIGKTGDARSLEANLFAHLKEAATETATGHWSLPVPAVWR